MRVNIWRKQLFTVPSVCAVGGALSSSFRCSILLMFPSMLGSRGHSYLMLFILSVLYKGPVSNMQRNVETAALSLSCNLDLQVNHSKLLWRDVVRPFVLITQELMVTHTGHIHYSTTSMAKTAPQAISHKNWKKSENVVTCKSYLVYHLYFDRNREIDGRI
uniref:Uncharacterized protein n=1 Tax=Mastacembelus armatus TaxID=205130 RepID=A0A3Q3MM35_9TELE